MFVALAPSPTITTSISGSNIQLKFPTQIGYNYTVYYSTNLNGGVWQPLSSTITGDGTVKTVTDSVTTGGARRFYKLGQ